MICCLMRCVLYFSHHSLDFDVNTVIIPLANGNQWQDLYSGLYEQVKPFYLSPSVVLCAVYCVLCAVSLCTVCCDLCTPVYTCVPSVE